MIQEAMYNFLNSITDLTDLVQDINWIDGNQQNAVLLYPAVTYRVISAPSLHLTSDQWQRWRFYIVGDNKNELYDIKKILEDNLNYAIGELDPTTGFKVDFIEKIDENEILYDSDTKLYTKFLDFRIIYH